MGTRGVKAGLAGLLGAAAIAAAAAPASAQGPEFVPLGAGAFPQLGYTWQANAVVPNQVLFDLYDHEGILRQTYTASFEPVSKRTLSALGNRPFALPTTASAVYGVAGTRVKKVKIVYVDGQRQALTPTPAPSEWGFAGRFFATGITVADASAATTQVVARIRAIDRKGKVVFTQTNVFTNPF